MRGVAAALWLVMALAGVLRAQDAGDDELRAALWDALGLPDLIEVMQAEGRDYGAGIGREFLPDGGGTGWAAVVARIYDPDKMAQTVEQGFEAGLGAADLEPLLDFFRSDIGQRIVTREIEARWAFLEPGAEEAAREAWRKAGEEAPERAALIEEYVRLNDLIEYNVAGALTANLRFYRGLAAGGAFEMTEEDMLADVWGQEAAIRADTGEWLMAYLTMAYADLSDADIAAYVALSKTPEGQALNRALFAGFDAMYADLSYALGLAVATQMQGEEL